MTVSALHARVREALVLQRLHTGWCPRQCFTAAMADSLRKVRLYMAPGGPAPGLKHATGTVPSSCAAVVQAPRHFVQREEEAAALRRVLLPGRGALPCFFYFLTGPSGGGKTTMVQRICHEVPLQMSPPASHGSQGAGHACSQEHPAGHSVVPHARTWREVVT